MNKFLLTQFLIILLSAPSMAQLMSVNESSLSQAEIEFTPSELKSALNNEIDGLMTKVVKWRHHFHQYPELGNREFETSKYIAQILRDLGLEVNTGIAYTGITAYIRGDNPGPLIALRADIDALPVTEMTNLPYA
ncbi:MAG: hypothetical protein EVB00_01070, partial [SAR86 cluster bacterium]